MRRVSSQRVFRSVSSGLHALWSLAGSFIMTGNIRARYLKAVPLIASRA